MRRWLLGAGLALVIASAAIGFWKREEMARLMAVNTLFAEDRIVWNFSHMAELFRTVPIPVDGAPEPLPEGPAMVLPEGWQDWLDRRAVTGVVVLHDGAVVHEGYHMGTAREDARISWSVAKSYLSALFGILHAQGAIESLEDPVVRYAPTLKGGAYDKARVIDVLQMSSGVSFDEDYLDFWSDINKMGRVLALGSSMDGFTADLSGTFAEPGAQWQYVSIDTHVLGMVLRGATGRDIASLMGEHVLGPLGAYGEPRYITDGYGVAFVLGGLLLTTRDYARMGEMFRQDGVFMGRQIVPADWARASTTPSARTAPGDWQYGYQWWIADDAPEGEFMARGTYGQYVYVDKASGVVIALNAADRAFRQAGADDDALQMFRRVAAQYGSGS